MNGLPKKKNNNNNKNKTNERIGKNNFLKRKWTIVFASTGQ